MPDIWLDGSYLMAFLMQLSFKFQSPAHCTSI